MQVSGDGAADRVEYIYMRVYIYEGIYICVQASGDGAADRVEYIYMRVYIYACRRAEMEQLIECLEAELSDRLSFFLSVRHEVLPLPLTLALTLALTLTLTLTGSPSSSRSGTRCYPYP